MVGFQRKKFNQPVCTWQMSITHFLVQRLQQETDWPEAVVTGQHGGLLVFHPPVVDVLPTAGQRHHKGGQGVPGAVAEALRLLPAVGKEHLAFPHIAGVLDGVFVPLDQIVVAGHPHDGNSYLFQVAHLKFAPLPTPLIDIEYRLVEKLQEQPKKSAKRSPNFLCAAPAQYPKIRRFNLLQNYYIHIYPEFAIK